MPTATEPPLTRTAEARLRKPRCRGSFRALDAARRQLGLLAVSDGLGEAHASWLVDLGTGRIEDARFLAFGSRWSHPAADAFTELVRGRTVSEACALPLGQVEALLRDDQSAPACDSSADGPLSFITDLQRRAVAVLPTVKLLPKPAEKLTYQRKREQDWTPADRAWLPLSLLKKAKAVDPIIARVLSEKAPQASYKLEGIHDDLRVVVVLSGLPVEANQTLSLFLRDALIALHPQISVELAS